MDTATSTGGHADGAGGKSTGQCGGHRRPVRRFRSACIVLIVCLLVAAAGCVLRSPSPVGHWDSAQGQDRFTAAYLEAFADMPEPEQNLDVRTDFGVVRLFRFSGSGEATEPLLLLPGRSSSSPVWADNLPPLMEVGDVYTVDLLGEPGMSVQERPIENDENQAAWLHQVLQELPEEGFHLVGLSIGGWNTVNLALHEPGLVTTMTLVEPVFTFGEMPLGTVVRSIPASVPWLPKSWRNGFNSYTAGGAEVEDVPVADMIEAGMQHYALKLPQPARIGEDRMETVDLPVLVIIAENSVMHDSREAVQSAERTLSRGTVHLYPGASHAVGGEHPDRIADDIAAFLANTP